MLHGRKRLITALTGFAALVGVALVPMTPTHADPKIDDVQARVDKLHHQAEQAAERFNDTRLKLTDLRADLTAMKADEARQQAKVTSLQLLVDEAIAAQYEGQNISATGQLVLSDDPGAFLAELTTLAAYNDSQAEVVEEYTREAKALQIRREATQDQAAELAAAKKALSKEKATADAKLAEAEALLDKLKEKDRRAFLDAASRGTSTRLPTDVPASGRAAVAIRYALAQLGDSYSYGATGPNAFDCSGLTMRAWGAAGVGLPHSSRAQQGSGTRVSSDNLQPGDLVFYYSPVSHVGMYIGGGRIVHAARPGVGVVISGVFSMPYSGAVRPG